MKWIACVVLMLLSGLSEAQRKLICISVDDLPTVSYQLGNEEFDRALTKELLIAFKSHQAQAIGFVNENKLYQQGKFVPSKLALLEDWMDAGMTLGNHTYDHNNYHRVSFEKFTSSIIKGEVHTRPLMRRFGDSLQYFRHPYLRIGRTASQADSLQRFLFANGYTISPVTIDNEDYLFALAYSRAYQQGDTLLTKKIGSDYIHYMNSKVKFFESQSIKLFDRVIAQTLLVHANLLNAHFMEKLLTSLEDLGYEFATQDEVLKDPAYNSSISVFGNWGISWIDRWALSQGKKGDFFKGDIPTPDYIKDLSK